MARLTSITLLLIALVGSSLGTYLVIFPFFQDNYLEEAKQGLGSTGRMLQQSDVMEEARLLKSMADFSRRSSLRELLLEKPADFRARQDWRNQVRAGLSAFLPSLEEIAKPRSLMVFSADGELLVDGPGEMGQSSLGSDKSKIAEFVKRAVEQHSACAIFHEGKNLFRLVGVSVVFGERVQAILVGAFALDDIVIKKHKNALDVKSKIQFAYIAKFEKGFAIVAGDLKTESRKALDEFIRTKGLQISSVIDKSNELQPQIIDDQWLVAGFPALGDAGRGESGMLLIREIDLLNKPFSRFSLWLLGISGFCFIVLALLVMVFGGKLSSGLQQLREDALEIGHRAGSGNFRVEGPTAIRDLAQLLNQIHLESSGPNKVIDKKLPAISSEDKESAEAQKRSELVDSRGKFEPGKTDESEKFMEEVSKAVEEDQDWGDDHTTKLGSTPLENADAEIEPSKAGESELFKEEVSKTVGEREEWGDDHTSKLGSTALGEAQADLESSKIDETERLIEEVKKAAREDQDWSDDHTAKLGSADEVSETASATLQEEENLIPKSPFQSLGLDQEEEEAASGSESKSVLEPDKEKLKETAEIKLDRRSLAQEPAESLSAEQGSLAQDEAEEGAEPIESEQRLSGGPSLDNPIREIPPKEKLWEGIREIQDEGYELENNRKSQESEIIEQDQKKGREVDELNRISPKVTTPLDEGAEMPTVHAQVSVQELLKEMKEQEQAEEAEIPQLERQVEGENYYRELFEEFIRAKQSVGESVEKLTYERFVKKLRGQEDVLKAKHNCKTVKFQVIIRSNQVSLRPRLVK